jgi:hypothetical protein
MTEEFFALEAPRASGSNVLISVLILSVIGAILSTLSTLISSAVQAALMPEYGEVFVESIGANIVCTLCGGFIGGIVGFYLSNGLVFLGARIFGGTGDFTRQIYSQSLFAVPIGIASGLMNLVPCLGLIAVLAVSIYAIVLNVRAIKAVHNLTTGRAVAAVFFVPAVVLVVVLVVIALAILVIVVLALMGPAIGTVFEDIVTTI